MFVNIELSCHECHDYGQDEDDEAEDGADQSVPTSGGFFQHLIGLIGLEDQIEHQIEKDVDSSNH